MSPITDPPVNDSRALLGEGSMVASCMAGRGMGAGGNYDA